MKGFVYNNSHQSLICAENAMDYLMYVRSNNVIYVQEMYVVIIIRIFII